MTDQVQGYTFQYAYSNEIIQAFANVVQPAYPIEFNSQNGNLSIQNTNSIINNTGGGANVAIGEYSLEYLTNGYYNIAIGQEALVVNSSGSRNIGIGGLSLSSNSSGSENIAIGYNTLLQNTTGNYNIAIGYNASSNTTGNYNIAIGSLAFQIGTTNVNNNIFIQNNSVFPHNIYPLNNGTYENNELLIAPNVALIGGIDNNTFDTTTNKIVPSTSSYVIIYGELATSFGGTAPTSITAGASPYTFTPSSTTNQIVIISGGSVSSIALNGTTTGLTSGTFYCRAGDSLTITYTTAPTILQYNV